MDRHKVKIPGQNYRRSSKDRPVFVAEVARRMKEDRPIVGAKVLITLLQNGALVEIRGEITQYPALGQYSLLEFGSGVKLKVKGRKDDLFILASRIKQTIWQDQTGR